MTHLPETLTGATTAADLGPWIACYLAHRVEAGRLKPTRRRLGPIPASALTPELVAASAAARRLGEMIAHDLCVLEGDAEAADRAITDPDTQQRNHRNAERIRIAVELDRDNPRYYSRGSIWPDLHAAAES